MIDDTLERIIPDNITEKDAEAWLVLQVHLERYRFALKHVQPGRLLDLACGVGYGSYFLAADDTGLISEIVAVDNNKDVIAYAKSRYSHPRIKYAEADALLFDDPEKFSTIVAFETIEHMKTPRLFLDRLYSLLLPGGVLLLSAPTVPTADLNPHHFSDFTESSLRKLVSHYQLEETDCLYQKQKYKPGNLLNKKIAGKRYLRKNLLKYYLKNPLSLWHRMMALFRHGFSIKYLSLALKKPAK